MHFQCIKPSNTHYYHCPFHPHSPSLRGFGNAHPPIRAGIGTCNEKWKMASFFSTVDPLNFCTNSWEIVQSLNAKKISSNKPKSLLFFFTLDSAAKNLLILRSLILFRQIFTNSMRIAMRPTSINATMLAIEAMMTNTTAVDTLAFTTFTTCLQITSGALPAWRTDTGIIQTLSMKTTVKATNSFVFREYK